MKKEYEKNKKLVILMLSVIAVCLAGGLFWYLARVGAPQEMATELVQENPEQPEVTVKEITIPEKTTVMEETEAEESGRQEAGNKEAESKTEAEQAEKLEVVGEDPRVQNIQTGSSVEEDGLPLTKEEAQPPEEPQVPDKETLTDPEAQPQYDPEITVPETKPQEPAGGSTNESGQIYVPGFGYMDAPQAPVSIPAGSDGDWDKQIGEMN